MHKYLQDFKLEFHGFLIVQTFNAQVNKYFHKKQPDLLLKISNK